MNATQLSDVYRAYLNCLNRQAWDDLHRYVHPEVQRNREPLGLDGYRAMLVENFEDIPDLRFHAELLVVEPPRLAARLVFRCSPRNGFLDLPVGGRTVTFTENVFYEFAEGRIITVWSVVDKAAIEAQI